jgi:hypothetical protein
LYLSRHDSSASGCSAKQAERQQNQVVEIHRVAGAQRALVARSDVLRQRGNVGIGERAARSAPPFL